MKRVKKYMLFGLCILLLAIFIRTVIGEPCKVPSGSMAPTIRTGSWLWIDKFSYGGRLPERWADIPLINAFTHIDVLRYADAQNYWGYRRLPGFTKPKVGDIVVFNSPENEERLLVKRITEIRTENDMIMYYLMGDNRDHSHDSRVFGWVPERLIVGKINFKSNLQEFLTSSIFLITISLKPVLNRHQKLPPPNINP